MIYDGVVALPMGVDTLDVVFPTAFDTVPSVIAMVENIETEDSDGPILSIQATVRDRTVSGFTAAFNTPTDSAEYNLVWYAGSDEDFSDILAVAIRGRRVSDLTLAYSFSDADYFPFVKNSPTPHTLRATWQALRLNLANSVGGGGMLEVGDAPAASDSAGVFGRRVWDPNDPNYIYECVVGGADGAAQWTKTLTITSF